MNPHKTSITTTSPSYSSHSSNTRLPLLVRRRSGGGTVWHDLGNSNYSISMPRAEFHRSIAVKLITQALHQLDSKNYYYHPS